MRHGHAGNPYASSVVNLLPGPSHRYGHRDRAVTRDPGRAVTVQCVTSCQWHDSKLPRTMTDDTVGLGIMITDY